MRFLLTLVLCLSLPVSAVYPSAYVKLRNAKVDEVVNRDILDESLLKFLELKPDIMKPKGKPYKVDQSCSFTAELDAEGQHIDLNSMKLLKHKNNLDYNLRVIEFLREHPIRMQKKNPDKPIIIKFVYLAF